MAHNAEHEAMVRRNGREFEVMISTATGGVELVATWALNESEAALIATGDLPAYTTDQRVAKGAVLNVMRRQPDADFEKRVADLNAETKARRAARRQKLAAKRLTKEERAAIMDEIERYVWRAYQNYIDLRHVGEREPNITSTEIAHHVLSNSPVTRGMVGIEERLPEQQMNLVRGIVHSMARAGRLNTSIGAGYKGREARCYEPAWEKNDGQ